jgi:hypothetical protein
MTKTDSEPCGCRACLSGVRVKVTDEVSIPITSVRMIVCALCGNKRCPHATYHLYPCTNSNEPGQPGSVYA